MGWTSPRTWVASEVPTAANFNTHVRDNLTHLYTYHAVRAYKGSTQSVTSGNYDVVSWDTESFDSDTIHDNVTNNSRFVVPSGLAGKWRATMQIAVDADAAGHNRYELALRKNAAGASGGGTALKVIPFVGHTVEHSGLVTVVADLVAGDYVEGFFRARDETQVIQAGSSGSDFLFEWLGG